MKRLAALVPRPRLHVIRFHGVLAPNARLRSGIISERAGKPQYPLSAPRRGAPSRGAWPPELGPVAHKTAGSGFGRRTPARRAKAREAFRKPVFDIDLERCPHCGGPLKIIAAIVDPTVIAKILTHLGLPGRPPPRSPGAAIRPTPNGLIRIR
jgi:hypothetical protein